MANILGVPGKATLGVPDYAKAIHAGLQNFIKANEAQYAPQMSQQDLQRKMYENVMKGAEAQYAPELAELGVKLKRGEVERMPFQQQLLQAQIAKALRPPEAKLSNIEKAIEGVRHIEQIYGRDSEQAKMARSYANRIASGNQGISVTMDPETGQPMVQIGGAMNGSGKGASNAGKIYQTSSGEQITPATGTTASNLQQRIIGAETVEPYINEIIENMPQFQNLSTQAKTLGQGLSNYVLGTNYDLPSKYASGKAAIKEASEGLLKTFGLNATTGNRNATEEILKPHLGESEQGYKNRVMKQLEDFVLTKKYAKKSLLKGVNVGGESAENQMSNDPLGLR